MFSNICRHRFNLLQEHTSQWKYPTEIKWQTSVCVCACMCVHVCVRACMCVCKCWQRQCGSIRSVLWCRGTVINIQQYLSNNSLCCQRRASACLPWQPLICPNREASHCHGLDRWICIFINKSYENDTFNKNTLPLYWWTFPSEVRIPFLVTVVLCEYTGAKRVREKMLQLVECSKI